MINSKLLLLLTWRLFYPLIVGSHISFLCLLCFFPDDIIGPSYRKRLNNSEQDLILR